MKLKRTVMLILMSAVVLSSFSSCKMLKKFFTTDLEDEDYIVGQLYADEYVKETPVHRVQKTEKGEGKTEKGKKSGTLGIERSDRDNPKLYEAIESWFGTPYLYGGCTTSGVDCSCFVGHIFKSVYGVSLHRTANDIQKDMAKFLKRDELCEGDVVFFVNSNGKVSHVGIYLKDDMFVHSSTSNGVSISTLENSYWKKHFYKGGRHKAVTTRYR